MKHTAPTVSPAELAEDRRRTQSALTLAAVSVLLSLAFFSLSLAVVRGVTGDVDREILLGMRENGDVADPYGPRWAEQIGRDMTALGGVAVLSLLTFAVTAFFWLSSMRRAAVYVAVASLGALAVSSGLKNVFDRPRPDLVPHGAYVYTASFPSGHATMAAAVYLTLGLVASRFVRRRRLKVLLISLAVFVTAAVGVSRVYLGVHWPSDVLGGWAIGFAWALVCWSVSVWLQDYGILEPAVRAVAVKPPRPAAHAPAGKAR
jgi:undecaprenyl-diphosphatase